MSIYFCSHVPHVEKLCTCAVIPDLQDLWGKQMDYARALRSSTKRIAGSGYEIAKDGKNIIAGISYNNIEFTHFQPRASKTKLRFILHGKRHIVSLDIYSLLIRSKNVFREMCLTIKYIFELRAIKFFNTCISIVAGKYLENNCFGIYNFCCFYPPSPCNGQRKRRLGPDGRKGKKCVLLKRARVSLWQSESGEITGLFA